MEIKQIKGLGPKRLEALNEAGIYTPADLLWRFPGGYIDSTPDGVPVIGEIASLPGFIVAAGFSGHGFGIAPGAGELVADLITGRQPLVEAAQYRPERFAKSAWGKVADF